MRKDHMTDDVAVARAHRLRRAKIMWVHVAHAGDDVDDHRKYPVAEAERDLGGCSDAEAEREQRQQHRLRDGIEQEDDWIQAAPAEVRRADGEPDGEAE